MHRTLKAETARPPAATEDAQQRIFDRFREQYNHQRPHEGIGLVPPAERYCNSPRPYPRRLPELSYPGHFEVRRVRSRGEIKWQGHRLFLSEMLHREQVGLEEVDDGLWSVYFGPVLIGRYDEREAGFEAL